MSLSELRRFTGRVTVRVPSRENSAENEGWGFASVDLDAAGGVVAPEADSAAHSGTSLGIARKRKAARYLAGPADTGEDLLGLIGRRLAGVHGDSPARRDTLVLEVRPHDGMTWVTRQAYELCKKFPGTETVLLEGTPGSERLPEIAKVIGKRRLCKLAQKEEVTGRFRTLQWPWVVGAVLVALLAGLLLIVFTPSTKVKAPRPPLDLLTEPALLFAALVVALAALAVQYAKDILKPGRWREALELLPGDIESTRTARPGVFERFTAAVAGEVALPRHDRVILVDGFDALDEVTRQSLKHRVAFASRTSDYVDFVLVTENDPPGSLATDLVEKHVRDVHGSQGLHVYRQLPLGYTDRLRIARDRGVPEHSSYETIGAILSAPEGYADDIEEIVTKVRGPTLGKDRTRYDCVDLVYLLAIPASCYGEVSWNRSRLIQRLADASEELLPLLESLLPGFARDGIRIASVVDEAIARFGRVLDRGDEGHVSVPREVGEVFVASCGRWYLAEPEAVHLFWAFVTHELAEGNQDDPYWVDKTALHAIQATLPDIGREADEALRLRLEGVVVYTLVASITGCMTHRLKELAERLWLLSLRYDELPALGRRAPLLLWIVSNITGEESIAGWAESLALKVRSSLGQRPQRPLLDLRRQLCGDNPGLQRGAVGLFDAQALVDALRESEAAWLAFEMSALSASAEGLDRRLKDWIADAKTLIFRGTGSTATSDNSSEEPPAPSSVCALLADINLVWTTGLALKSFVPDLHAWRGLWESLRGTPPQELSDSTGRSVTAPKSADEWFRANIDVFAAAAEPMSSYLRSTLARVACQDPGSILDSLLVQELRLTLSAAGLAVARVDEDAYLFDARGLAEEAAASAGVSLSGLSGEEASERVCHALDLVAIAWHAVGLPHLSAVTALRLGEFLLLTPSNDSRTPRVEEAVRLLARTAEDCHLTMLLADLSSAVNLGAAGMLKAQVAVRAAKTAVRCRMGRELTSALSLIAILKAVGYSQVDCSDLIEYLLSSSESWAPDLLTACPAASLSELAHALVQSTLRCRSPQQYDEVTRAIRERLQAVEEDALREGVSIHLDQYEAHAALTWDRPIDVSAMLSKWQPRPRDGDYAYLLSLLLRAAGDDPSVPNDAGVLLVGHASRADVDRDHLALADSLLAYARRNAGAVPPAHASAALEVLDRSIERYDTTLDPDTNVSLYRLLLERGYGVTVRRRERLAWWYEVKLSSDEVGRLRVMVSDGRYFQLFRYYCDTLQYYGLHFHWQGVPASVRSVAADDILSMLYEWREQGEPYIPPLRYEENRTVISMRFILLGTPLFNSELVSDAGYDDARQKFDAAAKSLLGELLTGLAKLERIPAPIRRTLRRHQSLFVAPPVE